MVVDFRYVASFQNRSAWKFTGVENRSNSCVLAHLNIRGEMGKMSWGIFLNFSLWLNFRLHFLQESLRGLGMNFGAVHVRRFIYMTESKFYPFRPFSGPMLHLHFCRRFFPVLFSKLLGSNDLCQIDGDMLRPIVGASSVCFIFQIASKPGHLKCDCGRQNWPNFARSD